MMSFPIRQQEIVSVLNLFFYVTSWYSLADRSRGWDQVLQGLSGDGEVVEGSGGAGGSS